MRILFVTLVICILSLVSAGQDPGRSRIDPESKTKIKTIERERTYLVINGKNADYQLEKIGLDLYDESGFLLQSSVFGNGERRKVFERLGGIVNVKLHYFDESGNLLSNERSGLFLPKTNVVSETDLCENYKTHTDHDPQAKIDRVIENCLDGNLRARESWEYDIQNRVTRFVREDTKSRRWEEVNIYDTQGNLTSFMQVIKDLKQPQFTLMVKHVQFKFDDHKNWIERVASAFDSRRPGQLIHQYIERRKYTYYEE